MAHHHNGVTVVVKGVVVSLLPPASSSSRTPPPPPPRSHRGRSSSTPYCIRMPSQPTTTDPASAAAVSQREGNPPPLPAPGAPTTAGGEPTTTATTTTNPATASADEGSSTLSKTTVCLPIVYGSVAFYLGKEADEFQTHRWTLYIRGPNHEDLSVAISKVVFQLHASFSQPIRELTSPPFEVTETGWGEFEAQIRIIWKDPDEKPTVVMHAIKLYPAGATPNALPPTNDEPIEPVLSERYDEVVFTDPSESFFRQLQRITIVPTVEMPNQQHMTQFSDEEEFLTLMEAHKHVKMDLTKVKEHFQRVTEELTQVELDLQTAHQETKKTKAPNRKSRPGGGTSKKAKSS